MEVLKHIKYSISNWVFLLSEDVALIVKEAYYRDVGRGIARINHGIIEELGLESGSIIEINGRYSVPAIVWPAHPEDSPLTNLLFYLS